MRIPLTAEVEVEKFHNDVPNCHFMSIAEVLRGGDTWIGRGHFCGGLRREFLTLLFITFAAQSVGAQLLAPPNLTTCDEAIKVTNESDGKVPSEQMAQYLGRAVALCKRQKGPDHVDTLSSMNNLAVSYSHLGRYGEAFKLHEETLVLRRATLGVDHPETLRSMKNLAGSYHDLGRYPEALKLREETLALRQSKLGPNHPDTLHSMNDLALSYKALGSDVKSLMLNEEVLAVRRTTLGPDHADTLDSMNNLALSYGTLGRYTEALKLHDETLGLRQAKLGVDHPKTLANMYALADSYNDIGRYDVALKQHEEALALRQVKLGANHPETLRSMNSVANSYGYLGRYSEAMKLYEETLALSRANLGPSHPDTLGSLGNLAQGYSDLGRYGEALKLCEEVLLLMRMKLGPDHPDTLTSMSALAISYRNLGRYSEALKLNEEALAIIRTKLGVDHPEALRNMNNLAISYSDLGRHAEALKLNEESLALTRAKLGSHHPFTLNSANSLAANYSDLGRQNEALKLNENTLALLRANLGADHPSTLDSMSNLASTYSDLGRHGEALILNKKALELARARLGADHPRVLARMSNLAFGYGIQGYLSEIPYLAAAYVSGAEKQRSQRGLSVNDRQSIFVRYADSYRRFARYLGQLGATQNLPASQIDGFDLADLSKARTLLESMAGTTAARAAGLPASEFEALQRFSGEIVALDQAIAKQQEGRVPDAETLLSLQIRRQELADQFSALQSRLKATYPKYAQLLDVKIAKAADARRLLASDQLILSYTFETGGNLAAWLLDASGAPRFIDLGVQARLKDTITKLRTHLSGQMGLPAPAEESQLRQALADILLKPLLADASLGLAAKKRWIIIPDGDLALLPFDILPVTGSDGKAQPLIETVEISIVQSWSVFAMLKEREAEYGKLNRPKSLFAMGNAVYNPVTHRSADTIVRAELRVAARGWSGADYLAETRAPSAAAEQYAMQNLRWGNLPGTALEIEAVAKVFPFGVDKYADAEASEANLQRLNKTGRLADYRYLLFSAHGYLASNPTLTSLVLSQDKLTPEVDGYVTAAEWPAYNFKSDLMVLSACDTGVGKTLPGEGVMGLPYALFVAGNKNTLLTLWPVADEATVEFMTRFFTRLKNGESQVGALTAVKREFSAHPAYSAPRFWAAFVLYGV